MSDICICFADDQVLGNVVSIAVKVCSNLVADELVDVTMFGLCLELSPFLVAVDLFEHGLFGEYLIFGYCGVPVRLECLFNVP
jgi:hypothetical protein